MEPDHAILLLIALKGAPISMLVAMAILNRPVSVDDMLRSTGYKRDVILKGFEMLIARNLVARLGRVRGWQLTHGAKQLMLAFDEAELNAPPATPLIEAPDPARSIKSTSRPGSSVVVVTQGREMTTPEQHPSAKSIKSTSTDARSIKSTSTAVQALVDLAVPLKRAERAVAAAVARGEDEEAILAKVTAGIAYCNSPAAESVHAPAQLIAARIEDGAPFTSEAFTGRASGGSASERQRELKRQRNADYKDYWARQLQESTAQRELDKRARFGDGPDAEAQMLAWEKSEWEKGSTE